MSTSAVPPDEERLTPVDVSDIANGFADLTKTDFSQQLKGQQSYYYWHGDAERRRLTGEQPVPPPVPKKLASSEAVREKLIKPIDSFSFLDDSNVVKVYITLAGELAGVSSEQVHADFADRSLMVAIETDKAIHKFSVDRLTHEVDSQRCKATVTKSGKLVLKLFKKDHQQRWQKLRVVT